MPRFAGASANAVIQNRRSAGTEIRTLEDIIKQKEDVGPRRCDLPYQLKVHHFYARKDVQIFVAIFIFLNFIISAIEAQVLADLGEDAMNLIENGNETIHFFDVCEFFFAYAFLGELVVNMWGNFFLPFFKCAWNVFDFFIVIISIMSLYLKHFPGISVLRLFRAFRVVRLFGRVKTMRRLMDTMLRSLPAMAIAFAALFLIVGIYAIIGVDFWKESFPDFFGSFFKAILTLLQVMTFDSWCSGVARDIIFSDGLIPVIYFVTYVFIASIVMINVLVALLLDEFLKAPRDDDSSHDEKEFDVSDWADHRQQATDTADAPTGRVIFVDDSSEPSSSQERSPSRKLKGTREAFKKERIKRSAKNKPFDRVRWKAKVDQNINTLSSTLAMMHTELDRLHQEVDELSDRFNQIPTKCTALFAPQRVVALNNLKDQLVGAISK